MTAFLSTHAIDTSRITADYNVGVSITDIATKYNKTERAIIARLSREGLYKPFAYTVRAKNVCEYCKSILVYDSHGCINCGAPRK